MNTRNQTTNFFYLTLFFVLISTTIFSQNYNRTIDPEKKEAILENFERCLNSENPGVRICTVEHVGRYKISDFENKLIDMLHEESNIKDKKIIALSLVKLGSLNSIEAINKSIDLNKNSEYSIFCIDLLKRYAEYDILRSKYFDTFAVNLLDDE